MAAKKSKQAATTKKPSAKKSTKKPAGATWPRWLQIVVGIVVVICAAIVMIPTIGQPFR